MNCICIKSSNSSDMFQSFLVNNQKKIGKSLGIKRDRNSHKDLSFWLESKIEEGHISAVMNLSEKVLAMERYLNRVDYIDKKQNPFYNFINKREQGTCDPLYPGVRVYNNVVYFKGDDTEIAEKFCYEELKVSNLSQTEGEFGILKYAYSPKDKEVILTLRDNPFEKQQGKWKSYYHPGNGFDEGFVKIVYQKINKKNKKIRNFGMIITEVDERIASRLLGIFEEYSENPFGVSEKQGINKNGINHSLNIFELMDEIRSNKKILKRNFTKGFIIAGEDLLMKSDIIIKYGEQFYNSLTFFEKNYCV